MNNLKHLLLLILVTLSQYSFANDLVISDKLLIQYQNPTLIAHTQNSLILKYKDWWFAHEIVNSKTMYPNMDLSDHFSEFIKSIFDEKIRKTLPKELADLSKEQAKVFGVKQNNVEKNIVGTAQLFAVYDEEHQRGDIYIIEKRMIHHIDSSSSKEQFNNLIKEIKDR